MTSKLRKKTQGPIRNSQIALLTLKGKQLQPVRRGLGERLLLKGLTVWPSGTKRLNLTLQLVLRFCSRLP